MRQALFSRRIALAALALAAGVAQALPQDERVPGGVAVVDLGAFAAAPTVRHGDQPVAVARAGERWFALFGIDLQTPTGEQILTVEPGEKDKGAPRRHSIIILPKDYPTQRLTIRDQRKVTPNPDDLARIEREQALTGRIKRTFTESPVQADFTLPAAGPLSSRFGLRRIFNGQPRNPHAGLDVKAPAGAAVIAPAAGVVVNTGDYFYNGNTVFLDHGQGLITAYMHLSRLDVQAGQTVRAGQTLGAIGATGRATGPHLHWAVFLNGAAVDPERFLPHRPAKLE